MIPEDALAVVRKWVDMRNADLPPRAQKQIRYELDVTDRHLTLNECRPPWRPDVGPQWSRMPVARFTFITTRNEWQLHHTDRNLTFRRYDPFPTAHTSTSC